MSGNPILILFLAFFGLPAIVLLMAWFITTL